MSTAKPPQTPVTPCFPEFQDDMCWSTTATLADTDSTSSSQQKCQPTTTEPILPPPPSSRLRRPKNKTAMLRRRFAGMSRPLAPLLSIETGLAHPRFPPTLLHYHLLSDAELEELARFYHQSEPNRFSMEYPMPVVGRWRTPPTIPMCTHHLADGDGDGDDMDVDVDLDLETAEVKGVREMMQLPTGEMDLTSWRMLQDKRRRFGRFMGLPGMESATEDGDVMREQMERWVNNEIARREARETELECWRSKGYW